jgi:hypothetical protein
LHSTWQQEILHRRGELDAGIVHQDIKAPEFLDHRDGQLRTASPFEILAPS